MSSKTNELVRNLTEAIVNTGKKKTSPYDTSATVTKVEGGKAYVHIPGGVDETPADMMINAKAGDIVQVRVSGGRAYLIGNKSNPPTDDTTAVAAGKTATVALGKAVDAINANLVTTDRLIAQEAEIGQLYAEKASVEDLSAATARIGELEADHVSADDLEASNARIHNLEVDHVTVSDFQAEQAKITTLQSTALTAESAVITNLQTSKADVTDLNAATGRITNLETNALTAESAVITNLQANKADVSALNAATARIGDLEADHVSTQDLEAAQADITALEAKTAVIDTLDTTYAQIDLANVNNAWIQNGVVKDASIADAKIIGMSANKLTAGTIDASNITVTNLNASNITTGTINGQRIGAGSLSLDKLSEDVYTESEVDAKLATMQDEIDGAIETWTGTVVPTLNNTPASGWTTNADKDKHVGDVYYVVNAGTQADGYCYRFAKSGNTYSWVLIKDSDVTAALQRLIDAEGDIDDLQSFESTTSSWITETDEELSSIKTNHTSLVAVVDKTLVSTTQLWYTKANTTAPNKPTAHVTSTSTAGNAWRTVVPAYNSSYPNYFYCYEWKYADGTYGWSDVTRDIGMGETQSTARTASSNASTALTNAATAQSAAEGAQSTANTANTNAQAAQNTANANIKSTVQLWFTKANTTAPSKPTAHVTTNNASTANAWNIAVPTYNATYPNYFYCYEYQKGDNTYSWSDVVLDRATTENQANARSALSQVATKVETSVFNTVSQQVDTNTANITSLSNTVETKADGSTVTTLSNTVNAVQQTANNNSSAISNLTTRVSGAETTISQHSTSITQNTNAIALKANATDVYTKTQTDDLIASEISDAKAEIKITTDSISSEVSTKVGANELISKINQSSESILISASKITVGNQTLSSEIDSIRSDIENATPYRYNHTYIESNGVYTFTATLSYGETDITSTVDPNRFMWFLRTETGDELYARGVTMTINETQAGFRGSVIGGFEDGDLEVLVVGSDGSFIIGSDGAVITASLPME